MLVSGSAVGISFAFRSAVSTNATSRRPCYRSSEVKSSSLFATANVIGAFARGAGSHNVHRNLHNGSSSARSDKGGSHDPMLTSCTDNPPRLIADGGVSSSARDLPHLTRSPPARSSPHRRTDETPPRRGLRFCRGPHPSEHRRRLTLRPRFDSPLQGPEAEPVAPLSLTRHREAARPRDPLPIRSDRASAAERPAEIPPRSEHARSRHPARSLYRRRRSRPSQGSWPIRRATVPAKTHHHSSIDEFSSLPELDDGMSSG